MLYNEHVLPKLLRQKNPAMDDPSLKYRNVKQIIIANVLESYYRSYESLTPSKRSYWRLYDTLDANRALLYNDDNKIVITSIPIHEDHLKRISEIMEWKNVKNLFPRYPSHSICEDLLRKSELSDVLEDIIKDNPNVSLIPYRATPEFYELIEHLKRKRLNFKTPETINEDLSFVNNYGNTKRGFRHLWEKAVPREIEGRIDIPEGFITSNRDEAIEAGWWFIEKNMSFVIKYNKGTQGIGIIIVKKSQMPKEKAKFVRKLTSIMNEKIWDEPTIVVEEFISVDKDVLGGSPSVEFLINEEGKVKTLYAGEQILGFDRKTFKGFYIHPDIVNNLYIKTAYQAGLYFGRELAELGYRGHFDIDLVIGTNGRLYAVESNLRRTGGTHIHQAAEALLGPDYEEEYHVSGEDIDIPKELRLDYAKCNEIFAEVLFSKEKNVGIIYGNPDMLQMNILHMLVIAKTKKQLSYFRNEINKCILELAKASEKSNESK